MSRARRGRGAHAIPTSYMGTRFRSRLEARWACFIDSLMWSWDYEPVDLTGYIPDFVVQPFGLLVECKPALSLTDKVWEGAQHKIEKSGWKEEALIVGSRPFQEKSTTTIFWGYGQDYREDAWLPFRIARDAGDWYPTTMADKTPNPIHNAWLVMLWREAGNKTQWKKPR